MRSPAQDELVRSLLERAEVAARMAGDFLIKDRPAQLQIESKTTVTDIVTDMDRRSEQLLVERLSDGRPDDSILGEEGAGRSGSSGVRWVIDPIDGTVNYVYGLLEWAVSIGIELDGVPVAGVVYAPAMAEMYLGAVGVGAVRNAQGGVQDLRVGRVTELSMALTATGFGYAVSRRRAQARVLQEVLPQVRDIRRAGAASVDLCSLACGRVDAYYERGLKPWDHMAAAVIAREAGARVEGLHGRVPNGDLVIGANPALFPQLHDLLDSLGADLDEDESAQ